MSCQTKRQTDRHGVLAEKYYSRSGSQEAQRNTTIYAFVWLSELLSNVICTGPFHHGYKVFKSHKPKPSSILVKNKPLIIALLTSFRVSWYTVTMLLYVRQCILYRCTCGCHGDVYM